MEPPPSYDDVYNVKNSKPGTAASGGGGPPPTMDEAAREMAATLIVRHNLLASASLPYVLAFLPPSLPNPLRVALGPPFDAAVLIWFLAGHGDDAGICQLCHGGEPEVREAVLPSGQLW